MNIAPADSDEKRDKFGKEIVKNLKARITELSETKYSEIDELNTPDMTFMFVGIDDTLSVALKYDRELTTFANKKENSVTKSYFFAHIYKNG